MGGGTQLFEETHLTGGIRAFVANQANVAITRFFIVKSSNVPPETIKELTKRVVCTPFKQ